jgi:flagellar hook-associated protein 3 FlgL
MRVTNKIIQNNNLANINTNKVYQDTLSTQMSTQKKINRPSDDPVVAIRALRLRSNVTELTQYYSKNIPDAESWLDVTEDSLNNLTEIVTKMIEQCTKGANGELTASDREIILEQLKALGDEVYSTADADYAGRYIFTGYRTDTSLRFEKGEDLKTTIVEQLSKDSIDRITVVNTKSAGGDDIKDINKVNYADVDVSAMDIEASDVYRIRLAYNNCDAEICPST